MVHRLQLPVRGDQSCARPRHSPRSVARLRREPEDQAEDVVMVVDGVLVEPVDEGPAVRLDHQPALAVQRDDGLTYRDAADTPSSAAISSWRRWSPWRSVPSKMSRRMCSATRSPLLRRWPRLAAGRLGDRQRRHDRCRPRGTRHQASPCRQERKPLHAPDVARHVAHGTRLVDREVRRSAPGSPRTRCGSRDGRGGRRGSGGCRSRRRGSTGRASRRRSKRSGSGYARSSRVAEPVMSMTFSPAGMVTPCRVTSVVVVRPCSCDGGSKRRISSAAARSDDGSADEPGPLVREVRERDRRRWGCPWRPSRGRRSPAPGSGTRPPRREAVGVVPSSSSSTSVSSRMEMTSSPGCARRSWTSPR